MRESTIEGILRGRAPKLGGNGLALAGGVPAAGNRTTGDAKMATYEARIKVGGKTPSMKLTIEANNQGDAKRLFEAQYGKGNIVGQVTRK